MSNGGTDALRIPGVDPTALALLNQQGIDFVGQLTIEPVGRDGGVWTAFADALNQAARFELLVVSAARGEGAALQGLRRFRGPGVPPGGFGDPGFCPISPLSPLAFVWAGVHMAGSLNAERQVRQLWNTYRSVLDDVTDRIGSLGRSVPGERGPSERDLTRSPGDTMGGLPAGGTLFDRARLMPGGLPLGSPLGPPLPERNLPCFTEQELCLGEILYALQEVRRSPRPSVPPIGAVTPADMCVPAAPVTVVLTPAPGTLFPATQADLNTGLGYTIALMVDSQLADIASWSASAITIRLPAAFPAGCHVVGWLVVPEPSLLSRLEGVGQQCGRYYSGAQNLASLGKAVVFPQVELSVIGEPTIASFAAAKLTAEACEAVELSWRAYLLVCGTSQASVRVSLLENGTIAQDYLPLDGTAIVDRETSANYTLVAAGMLGAQQCATAQSSLTISRTAFLRVTGPADVCVDRNSPVAFQIMSSCPAPAGGLPVTVSSSDTSRFLGLVTRINQGDTFVNVNIQSGSGCGDVTLTFAAPGYTSATFALKVAGAPAIASISPASFLTCRPIDVVVNGTCVGDATTNVRVRLVSGGATVAAGTATILASHTQLRAHFDPVPAGSYFVVIESCGRSGASPTPIAVTQAPPSVQSFSVNPSSADLCATGNARLRWRVRDASSLAIRLGSQTLATRTNANPCDVWEDELPVTPGLGQTTYDIVASVSGTTATATATATFSRTSGIPTVSSLTVSNQSGRTLVLWLVSGPNGSMLGTLAQGQSTQIQFTQCVPLNVVAVDPALVTAHNTEFSDNLQPSELRVAQNPRFLRWQANTTPFRFHSTGQPSALTIP